MSAADSVFGSTISPRPFGNDGIVYGGADVQGRVGRIEYKCVVQSIS